MRIAMAFVLVAASACSSDSEPPGPAACAAAGGRCVLGGATCPHRGTQDCNPDNNPGGAFCCLPCPKGTQANDAGTGCR
jgi:hypothetical protein